MEGEGTAQQLLKRREASLAHSVPATQVSKNAFSCNSVIEYIVQRKKIHIQASFKIV